MGRFMRGMMQASLMVKTLYNHHLLTVNAIIRLHSNLNNFELNKKTVFSVNGIKGALAFTQSA